MGAGRLSRRLVLTVLIGGAAAVWPAQAFAITNTPSDKGVPPKIEAGNPPDCGISGTTVLQAGPGGGTVTDGKATITVTSDGTVFSFNATTLPAGQKILGVVAKGGSSGANFYDYRPLGGVTSDGNLHPPPTGNGDQFAGISHILFCYGTPASTPPVTTPPSTTPPSTTPPSTTPPSSTPPTTTTSGTSGVKGTSTHKKHKKHKKHVKAKSISRPPRVISGFTG
jgi:hypothetical protein